MIMIAEWVGLHVEMVEWFWVAKCNFVKAFYLASTCLSYVQFEPHDAVSSEQ